jgi:hypothetical protein
MAFHDDRFLGFYSYASHGQRDSFLAALSLSQQISKMKVTTLFEFPR